MVNVMFVIVSFVTTIVWKGVKNVKLLNYDQRELIMRNVRCNAKEIPTTYTETQYKILCRLIRQKKIKKEFFQFLLLQLYDLKDWKQLNYSQMYELIHILTFYNYGKKEK
jgi:hypothetical protein